MTRGLKLSHPSLVPPHPCCVVLGNLLNHSVLQFPHL